MMQLIRPTVLSAATPSGSLTLGNYLGAIKNWISLNENYETFFMVADLHSLTVKENAENLSEKTLSFVAQYVALGLDPNKNCIFLQSQIPEHSELTWILSCVTPLGNLQRMTQFKDKSSKQKSILSGLLLYPVLMSADILLYQAKYVPVGEDQLQHLELCRDIVEYFHHSYLKTENQNNPIFTIPNPLVQKTGARIMSLTNPEQKMSKSDPDPFSFIGLLDDLSMVEKKIKKAVTDSGSQIIYSPENKAIANLMTIYSCLTGNSFEEIEKKFIGKLYGHFKLELAERVCEFLRPVQVRYSELMKDKSELFRILNEGSLIARKRASETLGRVKEAVGLLHI